MDEPLEGWYTDPYARHEARWMSEGTPTPLVRDGEVEGHDPAPEGPFTVTPVRLGVKEDGDPSDLCRADDAIRRTSAEDPADKAWDAAGQTMA